MEHTKEIKQIRESRIETEREWKTYPVFENRKVFKTSHNVKLAS